MSPDEIDSVGASWRRATHDDAAIDVLLATIADLLSGAADHRAARARWVVTAVSRLSEVLGRPTRFAAIAVDLVATRAPLSLGELDEERSALLRALSLLDGPLAPVHDRSWNRAIDLFAEIVASVGLDPFGNGWSSHGSGEAPETVGVGEVQAIDAQGSTT